MPKDIGDKIDENKFQPKWVWPNVAIFLIFHLLALSFFYFATLNPPKVSFLIYLFLVAYFTGLGITIGAHRYFTHRSFKATLPLKVLLLLGQTMAGQNSMFTWARDHRLHHKFSDTDADPHNSKRGFFFSHMGWLMMRKHPDVITKGKTIDMSDLSNDKLVMFQKKYYIPLYLIFAIAIPVTVPYYLLGESFMVCLTGAYFLRYAISLHATWCVNSFAHFYGTRPYTKDIPPVESNFVSFITSGEGWHNFHHTFPWDYRTGEFGKHFNFNYHLIDFFARLGLAYDLKSATPEMVFDRISKHGDGTHPAAPKETQKAPEIEDVDVDFEDIFGVNASKYMRIDKNQISLRIRNTNDSLMCGNGIS